LIRTKNFESIRSFLLLVGDFTNEKEMKVEQDMMYGYILKNADWGLSNLPTAFDKIHYALTQCPVYQ